MPTLFTYTVPTASPVLLCGSWDAWTSRTPMHRHHDVHTAQFSLLPGTYHYKYIDGGNWRHATDQATTLDGSGNLNNVITVESSAVEFDLDHSSDSDTPGGASAAAAAGAAAVGAPVGRRGPRPDGAGGSPLASYDCAPPEPAVVEPPALPPHLRTPSLRTGTSTGCSRAPGATRVDACGHVRLNHLFIAVPYDGVCCVGVVRRYQTTKRVTSLVYLAEAEVNE